MNNTTIVLKIKERLNKLDSQDFDNIPNWKILEAFNKGQISWARETLIASDESSTSVIEDLQKLIPDPLPISFIDKGIYFQSTTWPMDFLRYKRLSLLATNDCCSEPKRFTVYLGEEANVDQYLDDTNRKPNFNWGETFFTLTGDKINLYHDNQFKIDSCELIYYRQPVKIQISGTVNAYSGIVSSIDVLCEFNDDVIELLIDRAAFILSGDIENILQMQRFSGQSQK